MTACLQTPPFQGEEHSDILASAQEQAERAAAELLRDEQAAVDLAQQAKQREAAHKREKKARQKLRKMVRFSMCALQTRDDSHAHLSMW